MPVSVLEKILDDANLRFHLNLLLEKYNDYHHDAEVDGLDVYMGPNGFSTGTRSGTVTSDTTLDATDRFVRVDASSAAVTITLPAAASSAGFVYYIKKIDTTSNTVTIDGNGSETIDDQTTQVIAFQYTARIIECDGSEWWIH